MQKRAFLGFILVSFLGASMRISAMGAQKKHGRSTELQALAGSNVGGAQGTQEVKESSALITVDGQTWQVSGSDGYEQLVSVESRQCMEQLGYSRQDINGAILTMRAKGTRSYQDLLRLPPIDVQAAHEQMVGDGGSQLQNKKRAEREARFLEEVSWHINFGSKVRANQAESDLKDYYRGLKGLVIEKVLGVGVLIVMGVVFCQSHSS